jgi:hypothetical protein
MRSKKSMTSKNKKSWFAVMTPSTVKIVKGEELNKEDFNKVVAGPFNTKKTADDFSVVASVDPSILD